MCVCVYIYMPLFHISVPVTGLSKLHGWWRRFSSGNKTAGSETLAAFKWSFQLSACVFLSHCFCEREFLLVEKWTSSKCSGLAWLPLTWLSLQPFAGTWKRPMWPQQLRAITVMTRHLPSVPFGAEYSPHREKSFSIQGPKCTLKWIHTQRVERGTHKYQLCFYVTEITVIHLAMRLILQDLHFHTYFIIFMSSFNVDVKVQLLQTFGSKLFLCYVHTLQPSHNIHLLSITANRPAGKETETCQFITGPKLVEFLVVFWSTSFRKRAALSGRNIHYTDRHHTSFTQRPSDRQDIFAVRKHC